MSRKTPAPVPHFRPVSQKAYDTFVRRIYAVVPKDNRCADMIDALDKYLDGDRETYADALDEHTAITFEMLRFEIDLAIERSARARRPRRRKSAPQIESTLEVLSGSHVASHAMSHAQPQANTPKVSPAVSQADIQHDTMAQMLITALNPTTQVSNPAQKPTHTTASCILAPSAIPVSMTPVDKGPLNTDTNPVNTSPATPAKAPRWMRRAALVAVRPKNRWKKIG